MYSVLRAAAAAALLALPLAAQQDDPALIAKAKAIHAKAIKIDTHVDIDPSTMTDVKPNYVTGHAHQVDLPKMRNSGVDAVFFSIFVGQAQDFSDSGYAKARAGDVAKFEAVHYLAEKLAPDQIEIAYTAADVRRIRAKGKLVALMGVENGYGIGTDITNVKKFYDYGARYLSLAHNGHNQLSDSNTGESDNVWKWHGVSPLGKQVVAEANKYGIMLDISHPSKESNMWVMANSKAPVIASHSGVRALCKTASRDLDDEQLSALKKNGGVMQAVAFAGFVKCDPPSAERTAALNALSTEYGIPAAQAGRLGGGGGGRGAAIPSGVCGIGYDANAAPRGGGGGGGAGRGGRGNPLADMDPAKRAEFQAKLDALNVKYPVPARANVKDFVNHIDYAVKLIGVDHVGISSDFDGGGGIDGYDCTSEAINVTIELVRRGYTEEQIIKMWGGNVLRVMEEVEKAAKKAQGVQSTRDALPETGTFSIIAYDTATGEWGGAVQSRVFSVGNGVLSAEAGVGVVATQAVVDVSYGPQALALLRQGKSAAEVVKYVWEHDPDPDTARWAKTGRQFAVVDGKGNVAAYTGPTAPTAAGDKQGAHVTAQGNTLADKSVPDSMVAAFNRASGHLAFRLLAGIEAGQAAGGDKRGKQSAAMIIVKKCGGVWLHNDVVLKLQVDDSPEPIVELRRLVEKAPLPPRGVTNAQNDPACR